MKYIQKYGKTFKELRAIMIKHNYRLGDLGRIANLSTSATESRMAGRQTWRLEEAYMILNFFDIPHSELHKYFPENIWEIAAEVTDHDK